MNRARVLYRAARFAASSAGLLGVYELRARLANDALARAELLRKYKSVWLRTLLETFGVRVVHRGSEHLSTRATRLFVSNHRSALDIPVLLSIFDARFLSRADVGQWPVLGRIARHGGTIFVDRDKTASRHAAARAVARAIRAGDNVVIFPEGTTHAGDEVRQFFPGGFAGMRDSQALIVPVGLAYPPGTEYVEDRFVDHLSTTAERKAITVAVSIGEPVAASGAPRAIAESMRDRVQAEVHRARRLLNDQH